MLRKGIAITCLLCLAFFSGYVTGKKRPAAPGNVTVALLPENGGQKETVISLQTDARRAAFRNASSGIAEKIKELDEKIAGSENIINYLSVKTEQAEKASSLEASMVYEAQYRNALAQKGYLQKEIIELYKKDLQACREYMDFLGSPAGRNR